MSRYYHPDSRELERAELVQAAFKSCSQTDSNQSSKGKKPNRKVFRPLLITLKAERSKSAAISVRIDNELVFLEEAILCSDEVQFTGFIFSSNPQELDLRLELDGRSYNLDTTINCQSNESSLVIDQWSKKSPPRVYFDGVHINRGIGMHLEQINELPFTRHLVFEPFGKLVFLVIA